MDAGECWYVRATFKTSTYSLEKENVLMTLTITVKS